MASPYQQLRAELLAANAQRLREIAVKDAAEPFTLEIWHTADPKPGRLVIVQHWQRSGGFDYYVQGGEHETAAAIVATVGRTLPKLKHQKVPHGPCKVCGHYGDDCTGEDA